MGNRKSFKVLKKVKKFVFYLKSSIVRYIIPYFISFVHPPLTKSTDRIVNLENDLGYWDAIKFDVTVDNAYHVPYTVKHNTDGSVTISVRVGYVADYIKITQSVTCFDSTDKYEHTGSLTSTALQTFYISRLENEDGTGHAGRWTWRSNNVKHTQYCDRCDFGRWTADHYVDGSGQGNNTTKYFTNIYTSDNDDTHAYTTGHTQGNTIAQKKISDLKERVRIVNSTGNATLVSIHQNLFANAKYSGAQVFYAKTAGSEDLAKSLQKAFIRSINPGSHRQAKKADNVYLMQNIHCPGVLIECGFLSNPQEEYLLRSDAYQKKLCAVIATTLSNYLFAT